MKALYQHDQTEHPKDYIEPKDTKCLPSERTHKQKRSTADYQEINRRQEPISLPKETHNPQPEIKIEASVNVGDEEEEANHTLVSTDYYDDNKGYEEYQQDYEEQAQYGAVAQGSVLSTGKDKLRRYYHYNII